MEVGRLREGSPYAGRRLMFIDNGFVIDGIGAFPIRDVAGMSAAEQVVWASDDLRTWSSEVFAHAAPQPSVTAIPAPQVAAMPSVSEPQAPTSPKPVDPRLRKYSIVFALITILQMVLAIAAGPLVSSAVASTGGAAPLLSDVVARLSSMFLLAPMLFGLDLIVFVPLYLLGRFYKVGFVIAAAGVNLAITCLLAYAVYLPRLEVITLVK